MKKYCVILFAIMCYSSVFSQTTVIFKPGATNGQDAVIFTANPQSCIFYSHTIPVADMNFGDYPELISFAWTLSASGCPNGTMRSLLKFDELSTIPTNAIVISAELKLYGISSSLYHMVQGNSSYPGSPYPLSNNSLIQRVTSAWDEQTVTWNTQPTATTANQIAVPQSTSQWNWDFTDNSANLVTMVQDMINNPATNYGFMIKVATEVYYRSIGFASSNHTNPALWPELTVTYYEYECNANFSYTVNTANANSYSFTASNITDVGAVSYEWTVNGNYLSNNSSFTHVFPEGNHNVCLKADNDCEKCITFCVGVGAQESSIKQVKTSGNVNNVMVYPNPTTNDWTIKIIAEKEETVKIQLSDITGKIVYSVNKRLINGENSFIVNASSLTLGSYVLQVIGNTIQFSEILIKS